MLSHRKSIPRYKLLDAVKVASMHLTGIDRDDVMAFAETAPRVAAGVWQIPGGLGIERCYCPISGAGVDRLKPESQNFSITFDHEVGAEAGVPMILDVSG